MTTPDVPARTIYDSGAAGDTFSNDDIVQMLNREDPERDGLVVRILTKRMALALADDGTANQKPVKDPAAIAFDLNHTLRAIASIARHLLGRCMDDLGDDEREPEWATLVDRLSACADDFSRIGVSV